MPVRFLSDVELARLRSWPDEIAEHDLVTFFTLTSDDAGWLSGNIRMENRLGAAVQLCALPGTRARRPDERGPGPRRRRRRPDRVTTARRTDSRRSRGARAGGRRPPAADPSARPAD